MGNKAVVKSSPAGPLARPEFLQPTGAVGTEHIRREDMQVPRIAIAQNTSDQLKRNNPKFIEGLELGEMFNTVTGEVLGRGPLFLHIVRADPPRWVEFVPRAEGGGVKDPNVPAGDPRTLWNGNDPPLATQFYDFIVVLWPPVDPANLLGSILALSMKSTQISVAKRLNTLVKLRGSFPIYAGRYSLSAVDDSNAKGDFVNYSVANAGWVETPEQRDALAAVFEGMKERAIVIEREPGDDPPDEM